MNLLAALTIGFLCVPQPDLTTPGFRKVTQEVAIENPNDFDGWQVVAAMFLGPSHVTLVEPNVPFRYSSKYTTKIYAVPSGVDVSPLQTSPGTRRESLEGFMSTRIPVSLPPSVSILSPVERTLTTLRIVGISDEGIQVVAVREQQFDSADQSLGWFRLWGPPLGAIALGILGLIFLRRRRLRRAAE